ncbi:hypothetical protein JCM8097_005398 [Rhodosporidiobolus ruineniae]
MGQLQVQGLFGAVLLPTEPIARDMLGGGMHDYAWMNGLFVILGGRLGDNSARFLFILGYFVMGGVNLGTGFVTAAIPFDALRALAGIGAALVVPNSIALLARQYEPGIKRTVAFAVLGAIGPIGFMVHGLMASLVAQTIGARWIFWLEDILCFVLGTLSAMIVPHTESGDSSLHMDYRGAALGLSGMILFNFAFNHAPLVGWREFYVPLTLGLGLALIVLFFLWERRLGEKALLPTAIFNRNVIGTCLALWWGWMSFGCWLYYTTLFIREIRGRHTPTHLCAELSTITPIGVFAAMSVIYLESRMASHWILAISMASFCVGNLMLSVTPPDLSFSALLWPAEILVIFGPDLSFAAGALVIANSVPTSLAGVAGGLVTLITNYSMSIGLGIAGTVEVYTATRPDGSLDLLKGFRSAYYFATCVAFAGFILVVTTVRVKRVEPEVVQEKVDASQAV